MQKFMCVCVCVCVCVWLLVCIGLQKCEQLTAYDPTECILSKMGERKTGSGDPPAPPLTACLNIGITLVKSDHSFQGLNPHHPNICGIISLVGMC